ncbi:MULTISPECIES: GLUG motif-containing protein [unclassified Parabacteroides]|uniref:GLUG motif-containing protein n=1 Tax=unclassified Parabacteroides TaxID=2649774 RepID=UPI0024765C87|nr:MULTISPECIES: GLUG motif-containing protein [unclassified Parabacteroides]
MQAVITASISPQTRALGPDGFDGIVKKEFVKGDAISIAYLNGTTGKDIQATLGMNGSWETPTYFYINDPYAGIPQGHIIATYGKADTEAAGISTYADSLRAFGVVSPPAVSGNPHTVSFTFGHMRALLRATFADGNGQSIPAASIASTLIYISNDGDQSRKTIKPDSLCLVPDGYTIVGAQVTPAGGSPIITSQPATDSGSPIVTEAGKSYTLSFILGTSAIVLSVQEDNIPSWNISTHDHLSNTDAMHYIYDEQGLADFRDAVNNGNNTLNALQMADIELPANTEWTPIGLDYNTPYNGTYNGNGYTIKNLRITGDYQYLGLFGYTKNATLVNIHLADAAIKPATSPSEPYIGVLAAIAYKSTIALCSSSGTVEINKNDNITGGLVSVLENSHLSRSRSSCQVLASGESCYAGGLVGYNATSPIAACMAEGNVSASGSNSAAGGLAGYNEGNITHCYATGTATQATYIGGLVGSNRGGIYYSYTTQATIKGLGDGTPSTCWSSSIGSNPGSFVRANVDDQYKQAVNTWVNGEIKKVNFGPDSWTDADYPVLKYNNTGTIL